ncbi:4-oxalocrotonate decarboxylase [Priestia endophytica]|nr:fumarylacetoacetate hydrolase family protein [Priestia endophytica]RAS83742.1 4-oxalocrotonate decarboxylase [Priestia endophytica]
MISRTVELLSTAELERKELVRITENYPNLNIEEAYEIQENLVEQKVEEGYRILGAKMGLTSRAKMEQMGVDEPIYGYVFDYMAISNGELHLNKYIHPKVEAEIAFVLGQDIEGPDVTRADVLSSTDYVLPALEIIDSRYKDFKFTLSDVIADNASSSGVIFGNQMHRPDKIELDLVGTTLNINGEIKDLGAGAAVLGHPADSVAMLANMLSRKGKKLKKGDIILSGAITSAIMLTAGDSVLAKFDELGTVEFVVKE